MLNNEQKKLLTETAQRYCESRNPETLAYLEKRGITETVANTFPLGSVHEPASGHEQAEGLLSIPYITPTGVVGMKFRRLDNGSPKYLWPTGQKVGIFNALDLHKPTETIAICEGEIDTICLSGLCGIPAVGIAGVSQWKPHFPKLFEAYTRIMVFADNDVREDGRNPGMELAKRIKEDLNNATIIILPDNQDVNDIMVQYGQAWFKEKIAA